MGAGTEAGSPGGTEAGGDAKSPAEQVLALRECTTCQPRAGPQVG
jgi:hypothetical protein